MAILIKADKPTVFEKLLPSNGKTFTLEEMQKAVGGYIEFAPHSMSEDPTISRMHIVVDEEGILKNKPFNVQASRVVGYPLCGDVLLCLPDEIEEEGEEA